MVVKRTHLLSDPSDCRVDAVGVVVVLLCCAETIPGSVRVEGSRE